MRQPCLEARLLEWLRFVRHPHYSAHERQALQVRCIGPREAPRAETQIVNSLTVRNGTASQRFTGATRRSTRNAFKVLVREKRQDGRGVTAHHVAA